MDEELIAVDELADADAPEEAIAEDAVVEEVSIDGMCGVY